MWWLEWKKGWSLISDGDKGMVESMAVDKPEEQQQQQPQVTKCCRLKPVATPIVSREREQARSKGRGMPEDRLALPTGWWLWGSRCAQQ